MAGKHMKLLYWCSSTPERSSLCRHLDRCYRPVLASCLLTCYLTVSRKEQRKVLEVQTCLKNLESFGVLASSLFWSIRHNLLPQSEFCTSKAKVFHLAEVETNELVYGRSGPAVCFCFVILAPLIIFHLFFFLAVVWWSLRLKKPVNMHLLWATSVRWCMMSLKWSFILQYLHLRPLPHPVYLTGVFTFYSDPDSSHCAIFPTASFPFHVATLLAQSIYLPGCVLLPVLFSVYTFLLLTFSGAASLPSGGCWSRLSGCNCCCCFML